MTDRVQAPCEQTELVHAYAVHALSPSESAQMQAHVASCERCQRELNALRPLVDSFASWPTNVLRPSPSLQARLAERIAAETRSKPVLPTKRLSVEPEWLHCAPGISVKILAHDEKRDIVSMIVRLAPGAEYPPHQHAGTEELHLLDGELWIDDRKLYPGDYNRATAGTGDKRVWSETGCTCVLITSTRDVLR
jgi:anti-sigma factor ChrR (cupin superfamily)